MKMCLSCQAQLLLIINQVTGFDDGYRYCRLFYQTNTEFKPDQSGALLYEVERWKKGTTLKGKQVAGNFSLYWSDCMFFGLTWSCTVTPSASKLTNASPHEKGRSTMLKTTDTASAIEFSLSAACACLFGC